MKVVKTQGDPVLQPGEEFCADIGNEYFAYCGNYWPEFHDKGAFVYSTIAMCGYKEKLEVMEREDADRIVKEMNGAKKPCPKCGLMKKWKLMSGNEILEEQRMIENELNRDISLQR